MKGFVLSLALFFAATPCLGADPVALFYLTSNPDSIRSFLAHSRQIDMLVPTWYQVDQNGLVTGAPDPTVLKRAHEEGRSDDTADTIRHRQGLYKRETSPILAVYKDRGLVVEIEALGAVEEVADRITAALAARGIGSGAH